MSVLSFVQVLRSYFDFSTVGFPFYLWWRWADNILNLLSTWWSVVCGPWILICYSTAHATSYQVKPSEYAYHGDSVNGVESPSANCMNYPAGPSSQQQYIHCDGTQLLLNDSNLWSEQYQTDECYQWSAGTGQLLFIFPTRVSLTAITLHYYSNNFRGLPRLRFYALSDDFNVRHSSSTCRCCCNPSRWRASRLQECQH